MKVVLIGVLVAVALFFAVGLFSGPPRRSQAQDAIEKNLVDPSSVQYRNMRQVGDELVCGEFNAKNRLGGYVGYKRFAATFSAGYVNVDVEPEVPTVSSAAQREAYAQFNDKWRRCDAAR